MLSNWLARIAAGNRFTRDFTASGLRKALAEIAAHFPVYRSYVSARGVAESDRKWIDWAVRAARRASRIADPALFEVGPQYKDATPKGQRMVAAGIRHNMAVPRHWQEQARSVDAFDAKGDAFAVLAAAGAPMQALQVVPGAPAWFHPGRSGTIQIGPQNVLGWFGELHPRALAALRVRARPLHPPLAFGALVGQ